MISDGQGGKVVGGVEVRQNLFFCVKVFGKCVKTLGHDCSY